MLVLGIVAGIVLLAVGAALWRGRSEERIEFGPVRPVTSDPGMELDPAVSADGKLVAYVAGPIGELRIYVRSVSGGTPIQLIKDVTGPQVSPQWSPDGTRILFMLDGAIHVVPSLGGIPRVVVERGQHATMSPDGKAIAYVNRDTLLVRGVDGGPVRPLLTGLPELHSLAWSPDGKLIALIDGNAGWRGGNVSPSALMVIPASGGEPVRLTDRRLLHQSPAWMPDSRHLLFVSSQDGGRDIYALTLSGSGRPHGPSRRLTTGLDIGTFSVSADGKVLAYSSFPNKANIWSVPIPSGRVTTEADATPVTTGTQRVEGVAVSRDGEWIAFDSDRQGGNPALYRMRLGGGEPQQITSGRSLDFMPSFSPDGKEIVFHSWRSESRDVYVVPVGGGEEKLIAGGPDEEQYPDWSPDGRTVVFFRGNPVDTSRRGMFIVSRDPEGRWGEPRRLARGGFTSRWSPDGRWILYRLGGALWVISPQGGEPRQLINAVFGIWSPDSRSVYYRGEWDGRLSFWSVPVEGGTPTLLVRFESPTFIMGHFMFATDGKRLYFTVRDYQSDIKVMEVLRRK